MNNQIDSKNIIVAGLLTAILVFCVGAAVNLAGRTAWEYKTISPTSVTDEELNSIGSEGWELVNFTFIPKGETHHDPFSRYVFKRMNK